MLREDETYRENPKTKGSGIVCAIPQTGVCPVGCEDCFFQSGRSFLEPLDEHLPNMPPAETVSGQVVRVNDGNDSNVDRENVIAATQGYPCRFFNTSIPKDIGGFPGPVVLTVNPGDMTNRKGHRLNDPLPTNLMFVRFRTTTWNLMYCDDAVAYYTSRDVPVVLTFVAFFNTANKIPEDHRYNYAFRKRTMNSYWAITNLAWTEATHHYRDNVWVHSCGSEGVPGGFACRHCGNCLREFYATTIRMRVEAGGRVLPN